MRSVLNDELRELPCCLTKGVRDDPQRSLKAADARAGGVEVAVDHNSCCFSDDSVANADDIARPGSVRPDEADNFGVILDLRRQAEDRLDSDHVHWNESRSDHDADVKGRHAVGRCGGLSVFTAAVEEGSLAAAARRYKITPAMAGRHITYSAADLGIHTVDRLATEFGENPPWDLWREGRREQK